VTGSDRGRGRPSRPDGGRQSGDDATDNATDDRDGNPTAALSPDELAGVVDLFGLLTTDELRQAAEELAFRRGRDPDGSSAGTPPTDGDDGGYRAAIDSYHLVSLERDGEEYVAVGPVAFPTLPPDAEDLPHILDVPERSLDRAALATDVEERLRGDAARAVAAGDDERIRHLLDVTYDLETWAAVEVDDVRDRLDASLQA
jgi:hypothetical protein